MGARAYRKDEFTQKMEYLKVLSNQAHDWLAKIQETLWARHTFSTYPKCGLLSSNICESFNQYISDARDMPILTMLEHIRRRLMSRFQDKRTLIAKVKVKFVLKYMEKLRKY